MPSATAYAEPVTYTSVAAALLSESESIVLDDEDAYWLTVEPGTEEDGEDDYDDNTDYDNTCGPECEVCYPTWDGPDDDYSL